MARERKNGVRVTAILDSSVHNRLVQYAESQEGYASLFEDKNKYDAVMGALAGVVYREMRSQA